MFDHVLKKRPAVLSACVAAVLTLSGCGPQLGSDYSKVELLKVTGTVTLDGKPLPDAVITFEDPAQGTFSYAMTDSNGDYKLQFDSEMSGCTPGKKRVEISTTRKILGLNSDEEGAAPEGEASQEGENAGQPKAQELVPAKFNKKSELSVEVSESATEHDFALTSK